MMRFGLIFWSMFTVIAILFKVQYPLGAEQSTEIASRMFLIANIWAAGYILELRIKEIVKECVINGSGSKKTETETEPIEERRKWYV